MVDLFALALPHGLLVIALIRLLQDDRLDDESPADEATDPAPAKSVPTGPQRRFKVGRRA